MNRGSKVALFGTGWVLSHGESQEFPRRCLFLRVRTGCSGRLKVRRWRVGGPDRGLGIGLPRLGGRGAAWARSSLRDHRLCGSLAPAPEFSVQPAPRGPFPPAGNRPSPAGAAGRPRPRPRNLRSPGSRCGSRPARPPLPGDRGQHRAARSLPASGPGAPAARTPAPDAQVQPPRP